MTTAGKEHEPLENIDFADEESQFDVSLDEKIDYAYPNTFKVLIHNDHYTAMHFVVRILIEIFHKSEAEAEELMLTVHKQGHAVIGIYSREIAETKIRDVERRAHKEDYPLKLTLEQN